jgi:signal transduction histidine kinase
MGEQASVTTRQDLLGAVLAIGSDLDLDAVLHRVVESAVSLVGARYGALGVLDPDGVSLARFVTVGVSEETYRAIGHVPDGHGILGLLIADPRPLRLRDLRTHPESSGFPPHHPPMRSFLGVPIKIRRSVFGNLYLTDKVDAEEFSELDEELAVGLASAAAVAIDNARLHAELQSLTLMQDRERIARDLHDTVIQRLFATGLTLQATARLVAERSDVATRLEQAVDDLDETIKHIRSAIFGLSATARRSGGLGDLVLALVRESTPVLGFEPSLFVDGPVDSAVTDTVAADLLATLREMLTNVARHARASRVEISLVAGSEVVLSVTDDGVGPGEVTGRGRGLANMSARAAHHSGVMSIVTAPSGGTIVTWRVPIA